MTCDHCIVYTLPCSLLPTAAVDELFMLLFGDEVMDNFVGHKKLA